MGEVTGIAWTHSTFNPWIGCTKVGPGCDHCYAEAVDNRFYQGIHWGAGSPRKTLSADYWHKPNIWNRKAARSGEPWRVFCASQADVFDNEADPQIRARLFELIRATPHLTWLLLTKRIGNAAKMLPADWGDGYANVWLGATVVTQAEYDRDIEKLLEVPARIHWLSIEPQLEMMSIFTMPGYPMPDWVVVGGESQQAGGTARKFHLEWAKLLLRESNDYGVAFFMKQLGSNAYWRGERFVTNDHAGGDIAEWPEHLRVREFPVDTREGNRGNITSHDEVPQPVV